MFIKKNVKILKLSLILVTVLAVLIFLNTILPAQLPSFNWARRAGGTDYEYGYGIARDGANNTIITGKFEGPATFGSITLAGIGSDDIFIAKYDESGNVLWAKQAGGTSNDYGRSVATDISGDIIVTGMFYSSATFGSITLTSAGGYDFFIVKFDASTGNVLWAKRAGGAETDCGFNVETDESGNIFATGYFYGSATFGSTTLTTAGASDIFIAKYTGSGNLLWAKRAGGTGSDYGYGIATDKSGNCLVTGSFYGSA